MIKIIENNTPSWIEIEITGKQLTKPLTYKEYTEAYKKWIPKNDIPFNNLLDIILSTNIKKFFINRNTIVSEFEYIFNQIQDGTNRQKALTLFLDKVSHYLINAQFRKIQKRGNYSGYYKNHNQKIKSNKQSAEKVFESLIKNGIQDGTKTMQLSNLLIEYVNQCDKMLKSDEQIIEPLEIKDYKLNPKVSKEPMRKCLKEIIEKYDIVFDSYLLNTAIESIKT